MFTINAVCLPAALMAAGIQERTGRESGETDRVMQCVKGQSARKEFRCVSLSPSRKLRIALTSAMMLFSKSTTVLQNHGSLKVVRSAPKRNGPLVTNRTVLTGHKSGFQRQPNEFRFAPLFNRRNRTGCFKDNVLSGGTEHQFSNF